MVKTVALAVDGMETELLSNWISQGELPNIASLREEGAYGEANCSSLSSAKQWTTHFTGVSPDTHGVSGFLKDGKTRRAGNEAPAVKELINLSDISLKTYPELLSERGHSVGLINPLSLWPPLELQNGYCVSGLLTPPEAQTWAVPESLQEQLEESGYRIDVRYGDRPYGFVDDGVFAETDIETLYEDMFTVLDERIKFVKDSIQNRDTDFLYGLLKSIDVIQHCFWIHMENDDETYGDAILESYHRVDELIGWIREETTANLVVFSDHGFKSRTTRPPEGIHKLAVKIGDTIPVPSPVREVYESMFYRERDTSTAAPTEISGVHSNPAVWMAAGPEIEDIGRLDIDFEDIPPTLLTLLGEPIPEVYVGNTLTRALSVSPSYEERDLTVRRHLDITESDVVSERLHNLGYAEMVDS